MTWLLLGIAFAQQQPTLDDVLDSVERSFPLLLAAEADADKALAERLGVLGWTDPTLTANALSRSGEYQWSAFDVVVTQATPAWGLRVWGGYELGVGEFAAYEGDTKTASAGQGVVGAALPLLKGGLTDAARTDVLVRDAEVAAARARVEERRISYLRDARVAWVKWLASGLKVEIARSMEERASANLTGVQARIRLGDTAPIDRVDAERILVERQMKVLEVQRDLQQAAAKLSLYLRDLNGRPVVLDGAPPPLVDPGTPGAGPVPASLVDASFARRPEAALLDARAEMVAARLRLARIDLLPKLDLKVEVELPPAGYAADAKVGGALAVPLLQRGARGKLQGALAEQSALEQQQQYLKERVSVELTTTWTELLAAEERLQLAGKLVALAQEVEDATRVAFELGERSLLDLYLREQSTMKARMDRVELLAERYVAEAEWMAAQGLGR